MCFFSFSPLPPPKDSLKKWLAKSADENEQSDKYHSWQYQIMMQSFRGDTRDTVPLSHQIQFLIVMGKNESTDSSLA